MNAKTSAPSLKTVLVKIHPNLFRFRDKTPKSSFSIKYFAGLDLELFGLFSVL
jgi:hypothetical protein